MISIAQHRIGNNDDQLPIMGRVFSPFGLLLPTLASICETTRMVHNKLMISMIQQYHVSEIGCLTINIIVKMTIDRQSCHSRVGKTTIDKRKKTKHWWDSSRVSDNINWLLSLSTYLLKTTYSDHIWWQLKRKQTSIERTLLLFI